MLGGRLVRRGSREPRDPYEGLPTDELEEPVLPRWFVLLAVVSVPVAIVVFALAFFGVGRGETPVAERRPPPAAGLTSDVGDLVVGDREPVPHDPACPEVGGYLLAGTELDRSLLGAGLDTLCVAPAQLREDVAALGGHQPVLRFAAFEATGVDVAARGEQVYINARYSQTPSELIAPLVAYQSVLAQGDPTTAETVLAARRAELAACDALVDEPGRACEDAAALLALGDPEGALREAGFR